MSSTVNVNVSSARFLRVSNSSSVAVCGPSGMSPSVMVNTFPFRSMACFTPLSVILTPTGSVSVTCRLVASGSAAVTVRVRSRPSPRMKGCWNWEERVVNSSDAVNAVTSGPIVSMVKSKVLLKVPTVPVAAAIILKIPVFRFWLPLY